VAKLQIQTLVNLHIAPAAQFLLVEEQPGCSSASSSTAQFFETKLGNKEIPS
jgi:hypothetical protein